MVIDAKMSQEEEKGVFSSGCLNLLADVAIENALEKPTSSTYSYGIYHLPTPKDCPRLLTALVPNKKRSLRFNRFSRQKIFLHRVQSQGLEDLVRIANSIDSLGILKDSNFFHVEKKCVRPPIKLILKLPFNKRVLREADLNHVANKISEGKRKLESSKENARPVSHPVVLPSNFREKIMSLNGTEVKLVIQKKLFDTDVNKGNNRLSFPKSQTEAKFLEEREEAILDERTGEKQRPCGIQVPFLDTRLQECSVCLKKWVMTGRPVYNLVGNWSKIVEANTLRRGDVVQLWSFRVNGELSFALVRI